MKNMNEKILTTAQLQVIGLLISGESMTDAAQVAGVSRKTVSTWKNSDSLFRAELLRRQSELFADSREQLRASLPKAINVLIDALDSDRASERLRAASMVINLHNAAPSEVAAASDVPVQGKSVTDAELDGILSEMRRLNPAAFN